MKSELLPCFVKPLQVVIYAAPCFSVFVILQKIFSINTHVTLQEMLARWVEYLLNYIMRGEHRRGKKNRKSKLPGHPYRHPKAPFAWHICHHLSGLRTSSWEMTSFLSCKVLQMRQISSGLCIGYQIFSPLFCNSNHTLKTSTRLK